MKSRMSLRVLCAVTVGACVWWSTDSLVGQAPAASPGAAAKTAPAPAPRTPWGHPDLQGTWDYRTITPLERPREFGTREFYTEEEVKTLEGPGRPPDGRAARGNSPGPHARAGTGPIPAGSSPTAAARRSSWTRRTAAFPPLTAEGRARQARAPNRGGTENASWLDRGNQERCITYGLPSASLPTLYNNNIQIVQTPDTAVIVHEMIHEARVVPLDGRPRLTDGIRHWIGSSRGWWEGDTLVVETTNFSGKNNYRGSTTGLHLTERYTRVGKDRLEMRLTVSDPTTWEKPWTVLLPMRPTEGELIEYACHEGNLSMVNLLEVARDAEKAAAAERTTK